jgi:hypothetical protein
LDHELGKYIKVFFSNPLEMFFENSFFVSMIGWIIFVRLRVGNESVFYPIITQFTQHDDLIDACLQRSDGKYYKNPEN